MTFYFGDILPYMPLFLRALLMSIVVTGISFALGSVIGIAFYQARVSRFRVLRAVATIFIETFRNTPLLVQLYLIYFGLPEIGLNFDPFVSTLIGMTLNNAAYTAEIFRGGIEAVPKGLVEAGRALGLRGSQVFFSIVLKPGMRNVLPALTNQLIVLFLFSSVGSVIALDELTNLMSQLTSQTQRVFEVFAIGGLMYYFTSVVIAQASSRLYKTVFRW